MNANYFTRSQLTLLLCITLIGCGSEVPAPPAGFDPSPAESPYNHHPDAGKDADKQDPEVEQPIITSAPSANILLNSVGRSSCRHPYQAAWPQQWISIPTTSDGADAGDLDGGLMACVFASPAPDAGDGGNPYEPTAFGNPALTGTAIPICSGKNPYPCCIYSLTDAIGCDCWWCP